MRAIVVRFILLLAAGVFGVCAGSGQAVESLAGLTPGVSTVADAVRVLGRYDVSMPGSYTFLVGGQRFSIAYRWSPGIVAPSRGLTVETAQGSTRVDLVMVDAYPGVGTSRGLMVLVSENQAVERYGLPDFAYDWRFGDQQARELYYLDAGLVVILSQVTGRPNWTVTRLIVTHPANLANAVALRTQYASVRGSKVEDITYSYRVWARLAIPAE